MRNGFCLVADKFLFDGVRHMIQSGPKCRMGRRYFFLLVVRSPYENGTISWYKKETGVGNMRTFWSTIREIR